MVCFHNMFVGCFYLYDVLESYFGTYSVPNHKLCVDLLYFRIDIDAIWIGLGSLEASFGIFLRRVFDVDFAMPLFGGMGTTRELTF